MRTSNFVPGLCLFLLTGLFASEAKAQYRNKTLGFDLSYMAITKPGMKDAFGQPLSAGNRGDRLTRGIRLGGEGSFKLHRDHWWFSTRLDLMSLMFAKPRGTSIEEVSEALAAETLGFNMGLEGLVGVRYYFLTDRVRPYLQLGVSYMHIFSFGSANSATCTNATICTEGLSYGDSLMPRRNFVGFHASPSIEFIVARDVALHVILDYARWVVFRGKGNNVFTGGLGVTLFG